VKLPDVKFVGIVKLRRDRENWSKLIGAFFFATFHAAGWWKATIRLHRQRSLVFFLKP